MAAPILRLLRTIFFMAINLSGAAFAQEATDNETEWPPNIVLIISDDQGWGDFGFMGHSEIRTPNLDQLARESLVFQRGYVPHSLCRASLASIITGLYPRQHRIVSNDPRPTDAMRERAGSRLMVDPDYMELRSRYIAHIDRVATLPKRLKQRGYQCLQTGKWWEGHHQRGGFDVGMTHGDMTRGGRHGDEGLKIGRQGLQPIEDFIQQCLDQRSPFFVWYAPMMPHTPHDPPQRLLDQYLSRTPSLPVAKYWAMCEWFDETVGALRQVLDRHGVAKDTVIFFVCDNGWINDTQASQYAPRSKRTPYEGGIRTPIMVHWPDHVQPRTEKEQLASSLDVVPTALYLAGLPRDPALPGVNLLDTNAVASRQSLCGEVYDHDASSIDDPLASLRYRWIIDGSWKLIEPTPHASSAPSETVQLFDLAADPSEAIDLAEQHPAKVSELLEQLHRCFDTR